MHHETRVNSDADAARDSEPFHTPEVAPISAPVQQFAADVEAAIADDLAAILDGWNPLLGDIDDRPRASCLACRQLVLVAGRGEETRLVGPDESELEELTEQVAWETLGTDPADAMRPIQWWATPGPHRCEGAERDGSLACWDACQSDQFPVFPTELVESIRRYAVPPDEVNGRAVFARMTDGRIIVED